MNDHDPKKVEFGSEVRRLETPGHRRLRRRNSLIGTLLLVLMSVNLLYAGVDSMQTGKWVYFHKGLMELPGVIVVAMALFLLALSAWLLRRYLTNKD